MTGGAECDYMGLEVQRTIPINYHDRAVFSSFHSINRDERKCF